MKNLKVIFLLILFAVSYSKLTMAETENEKFFKVDQEFNTVLDGLNIKFQKPLESIDENLKKYLELTKLFEQFKNNNLELGQRLLNKIAAGDPLSGDDLYYLRRTTATFYKMNRKMLDFAKIYNFGGFEQNTDVNSPDQHLPLIKAHLIYLSGHVLVLDHIVKVHKQYFQSSSLFRRIIKNSLKDKESDDSKTLKDIVKLSEYAVNVGNKKEFSNQIILARNITEELKKIFSNDESALSLINLIETNDTARDISQGKNDFDLNFHGFIDTIVDAFNKVTNWFSQLFGNIAGSIRWRKGFMYENETLTIMLKEKLKPMDVILEKSPFVLTDKFIPGHYGHVALYLGTKEQLEAINMWNHPSILPYQEEIEAGNVILEAVRPGVKISKLEEFLNIDEITISRKKDALENPDILIEGITRGMDQIGKDYDFNFDIETLDKIVCSELIYIIYGQVKWPTKYRLGRATISPDDVAEVNFQKNSKFNIEQYLVSPERHRVEMGSIPSLARELNFVMRAEDGSPIKDPNDPTNSFFKLEEKCYILGQGKMRLRECKTTYTLEYYAERTVGN